MSHPSQPLPKDNNYSNMTHISSPPRPKPIQPTAHLCNSLNHPPHPCGCPPTHTVYTFTGPPSKPPSRGGNSRDICLAIFAVAIFLVGKTLFGEQSCVWQSLCWQSVLLITCPLSLSLSLGGTSFLGHYYSQYCYSLSLCNVCFAYFDEIRSKLRLGVLQGGLRRKR